MEKQANNKFPHQPVIDAVQSIVPDKLITELEAEVIESRRAFLVLADTIAQYRYQTQGLLGFLQGKPDLFEGYGWMETGFESVVSDIRGLNKWATEFFERFSETGFVVDDNGHLAHISEVKTPAASDETEAADPVIIGG